MIRELVVFTALCGGALAADSLDMHKPVIPLWPAGAPGSEGKTAPERWITHAEAAPGEQPAIDSFHRVTDINQPSLTVFLPPKDKATGAAFVIAPGGGHKYLVVDIEGQFVAEKLNGMGIAAFVLKNRLARAKGSTYKADVESLADAQRAIRTVRTRAREWNVDPNRVGIMGFSAGGELAALAETRYDAGKPGAPDPIDHASSKPDFVVLGYPGFRPGSILPTRETPPTFLFVNHDDGLSVVAAEYYIALKKAGVPAELHVFDRGGHGFGVTGRTPEFKKLPVAKWPDRLQDWMTDMGFLHGT